MERELTLNEIYKASHVLKNVVRQTNLVAAPTIRKDTQVYLKPENLQVTGSFKVRGASYMISQLSEEEKKCGVIACSAGNHAQGVASAAAAYGIKSTICLPAGAPISKVEATRAFGAEICLVPGVYDDAYAKAIQLRDERKMTFVHPFDNPLVIAGQGTIGIEILNDMPDVDAIIVPIGGGGLISGVAYAAKQLNPKIKVYGVQSAGAPSMLKSIEDGKIETLSGVKTIADGIAVKQPGVNTFDLVSKYVDKIVTVSDDEICAAILHLLEKYKMIAEGAGAVSIAAAMFNKVPLEGKNVCCIVSGGNIDVTILSRVINRGLMMGGRTTEMVIELPDRAGSLLGLTKVISDLGANIISIHHERNGESPDVNSCNLRMVLETRNHDHIAEIQRAISKAEYHIM